MSLIITNQLAASMAWTKVVSLEDVIDWHLTYTPWIGRKCIMDLAKIYAEKRVVAEDLLEKGEDIPEEDKFQDGGEFGQMLRALYS